MRRSENSCAFSDIRACAFFIAFVEATTQVQPNIVAFSDGQGSVEFNQVAYVAANTIVLNVTSSLSLNPSSTLNITQPPTGSQKIQVSFIDTTQTPSVSGGSVTSVTGFPQIVHLLCCSFEEKA